MAKFRKLAVFFAACIIVSTTVSSSAEGSILSVEGGVYSRVTARIDADAVPRQHCRRVIKNLQVSGKVTCFDFPCDFPSSQLFVMEFDNLRTSYSLTY